MKQLRDPNQNAQKKDARMGGKKDLWLVVFDDVILRCQGTGTTPLPLVSSTNSRTNSLPDMQGKSKYATSGRRNSHTKPQNLYKFIKVRKVFIMFPPWAHILSTD